MNTLLIKDLSHFVSKRSLVLFERFGLSTEFLDVDITLWASHRSFQENIQFFSTLKVVNYVAERNVALITKYNQHLTNSEEQFQGLLQTVKKHREDFPSCSKKNFM